MAGIWVGLILLGAVFLLFCIARVSTPYDRSIDDAEQEEFLKKDKD